MQRIQKDMIDYERRTGFGYRQERVGAFHDDIKDTLHFGSTVNNSCMAVSWQDHDILLRTLLKATSRVLISLQERFHRAEPYKEKQ